MGIRVHKCLGYGFTDFKGNFDPRLSKQLNEILEENEDNTTQHFVDYIKRDDIRLPLKQMVIDNIEKYEHHKESYDYVVHDDEFGIENIILFIPPGELKTWHRYDNCIDYHEETELHNQENHVEIIPNGIYPFNGTYCHIETNEQFSAYQYGIFKKLKEAGQDLPDSIDFEKLIIKKPEALVYFLEFLEIFTDKKYINDLQPMCYTYWS